MWQRIIWIPLTTRCTSTNPGVSRQKEGASTHSQRALCVSFSKSYIIANFMQIGDVKCKCVFESIDFVYRVSEYELMMWWDTAAQRHQNRQLPKYFCWFISIGFTKSSRKKHTSRTGCVTLCVSVLAKKTKPSVCFCAQPVRTCLDDFTVTVNVVCDTNHPERFILMFFLPACVCMARCIQPTHLCAY